MLFLGTEWIAPQRRRQAGYVRMPQDAKPREWQAREPGVKCVPVVEAELQPEYGGARQEEIGRAGA